MLQLFAIDAPELGYDVAGIRCAALYYAQHEFAKTANDVRSPSKKQLSAGERFLEASAASRQAAGMSLTDATLSTEKDALKTIAAYVARYKANAAGQMHPWRNDPLIKGDLAYCEALAQ